MSKNVAEIYTDRDKTIADQYAKAIDDRWVKESKMLADADKNKTTMFSGFLKMVGPSKRDKNAPTDRAIF